MIGCWTGLGGESKPPFEVKLLDHLCWGLQTRQAKYLKVPLFLSSADVWVSDLFNRGDILKTGVVRVGNF